jgi:peptidoglycan-associated lipoprotein
MRKFRLFTLTTVALFGSLSACAHSQATKQTPEGPKLGTPAEEKPKRPTEAPPPAANNNTNDTAAAPSDTAVFFDYNSALLPTDARPVLQRFAEQLKANRKSSLRIEGNCDERGTTEYNLALGAHRAEAARQYLERLGVSGHRVKTISYGKDRPKYEGHDESAWTKNRRDDLVVK